MQPSFLANVVLGVWLWLFAGATVQAQSYYISSIVPSFVLSRTTCAAPCGIFLNLGGTTGATRPALRLGYKTTWGDPGGTWPYGGQTDKNTSIGPWAAHVYEAAGTYSINSLVTGASGSLPAAGSVTVTSEQSSFANVVCLSTSTTPVVGSDGCPSYATAVANVASLDAASAYFANSSCVHLRHDDTFNTVGNFAINKTLGCLDWYGSGAKPIIRISATITTGCVLQLQNSTDWRVRNLQFDFNSSTVITFCFSGTTNNLLMESNTCDGGGGKCFTCFNNDAHLTGTPYIFIVGNTCTNLAAISGNANCFQYFTNGAYYVAMLGNNFDGAATCSGGFTARFQTWNYVVVENNRLANQPTGGKDILRFHGPTSTLFAVDQYAMVRDNEIVAATGAGGSLIKANSQTGVGELGDVDNVIIEANHLVESSATINPVTASAINLEFRDNICDASARAGGATAFCIVTGAVAGFTAPATIDIVGNVLYAPNTSTSLTNLFTYGALTGAWDVRNNIVYSPQGSIATGTGSAPSPLSNNSSSVSTNPNFVNAGGSMALATDFKLSMSSYACHAGAAVAYNVFDYGAALFPMGSTNNMGAWQTGSC
jgi:hypothetical protein